jgi:hypothetical protein
MPDLLWALKIVADITHEASLHFPNSTGVRSLKDLRDIKIVIFQLLNRISWNATGCPGGYIIGWQAWFLS